MLSEIAKVSIIRNYLAELSKDIKNREILDLLMQELTELFDNLKGNRKGLDLRRKIDKLRNYVSGILDALDDEPTEQELTKLRQGLLRNLKEYDEVAAIYYGKLGQKERILEEGQQMTDSEIRSLLKTGRKTTIRALPTKLDQEFAIVETPIVPIIGSAKGLRTKLIEHGFKVSNLEGYIVLEDQQILICHSREDIRDVLALINSKRRDEYTLVTERVIKNPLNTNLVCAWVMTSHQLDKLRRLMPKVKEWNFPLSMETGRF